MVTFFSRLITAALVCAALGGCAFTPHDVNLQPIETYNQSGIGAGTHIFFRFVDERDDLTLGARGAAGQGSRITANALPATMQAQLRDVLARKGFGFASAEGDAEATVNYRMRSFKFEVETGFWTGSDNVSAVLAVDALRHGRTYTSVYRFNSQHTAIVVPGGGDLDAMLSAAMNDLLRQADADSALFEFLAKGP
jgi:uncharacterized lipoprotein